MNAIITFLILAPFMLIVIGLLALEERYDVLDRMAERSTFAARLRDLINGPTS